MKKLLFTVFLSLFISLFTIAQEQHSPLTYKVRTPLIDIANPPLLVLMHGYGSNEKDLFSFAKSVPNEYLIISIRAPYDLGNDRYAWFRMEFSSGERTRNLEDVEKSKQLILNLLDDLQNQYHYDKKKVILSGFSQGAIMSYTIGLTHPEKVYGIGALSGFILDNTQPSSSKSIQNLKVFISHGIQDPVISIDEARKAKKMLESLGVTPEYHEYTAKHEINQAIFTDYIQWLMHVK